MIIYCGCRRALDKRREQREEEKGFSNSFCHALINANPHELCIKMGQIYLFEFRGIFILPSILCQETPVFLCPVASSQLVTLLNIYIKPAARKSKNAMQDHVRCIKLFRIFFFCSSN